MTAPSIPSDKIPYLTLADALALHQPRDTGATDHDSVLASLLTIWRNIFERADIAEADDFFLLGGHSLKALQLQVHVRSALQYEMDLRILFDAPTVGELADHIVAEQARVTTDDAAIAEPSSGNLGYHLYLSGLDAARWERCANQAVEQHEALRASVTVVDGAPRLRIRPHQPFALSWVDLSAEKSAEGEAQQQLIADLALPFDLSGGPLYRFGCFRLTSDHTLVSLTLAPGVGDGDLPRAIVSEMLAAYEGLQAAPAVSPAPTTSTAASEAAGQAADSHQGEAAAECIVPLHREGTRRPIFVVGGVGGGTMNLLRFVRELGPDQPIYGIQPKGYSTRSNPLSRVETMAAYYIEAMRSVQPAGPYILFGYSFGGIPALEMAQQLHAQGETVQLLGVLDTWIGQDAGLLGAGESGLSALASRAVFRLRELLTTPPDQRSAYLSKRWQLLRNRLGKTRKLTYERNREAKGEEIPAELKKIQALSEQAMKLYEARPYPGEIVLFQSQETSGFKRAYQTKQWQQLAGGGLLLVPVPGNHISMLRGENAAALARAVGAQLARTS